MNRNVTKLILRRIVAQLRVRLLAWLFPLFFILLLVLIMYWLGHYECQIARAIGYPTVKPTTYPPFFRREHECYQ
jgi:hypothetical protein